MAVHGGAFPGSGRQAEPAAELTRLRGELARVTKERDILKKPPKNELVHHQRYHTRDEARREIFAVIEGFYNRQRLHQSLGYLSLLEFERWIGES